MSLFNKLSKILTKKSPACNNTDTALDINNNAQAKHNQYAPKNTKILDFSISEKQRRITSLSVRENETFLLLLEGFTLKECARQMNLKYSTVNTYMTGIYKKLGVNTRAELIINYRETT